MAQEWRSVSNKKKKTPRNVLSTSTPTTLSTSSTIALYCTGVDANKRYFEMLINFKVKEPPTPCLHRDTESLGCMYYHKPEERRRPLTEFYIPQMCDLALECKNPDCNKAHTRNEVSFHPNLYKKYPCNNKNHTGYWLEKHRFTCSYLHDSDPDISELVRKEALALQCPPHQHQIAQFEEMRISGGFSKKTFGVNSLSGRDIDDTTHLQPNTKSETKTEHTLPVPIPLSKNPSEQSPNDNSPEYNSPTEINFSEFRSQPDTSLSALTTIPSPVIPTKPGVAVPVPLSPIKANSPAPASPTKPSSVPVSVTVPVPISPVNSSSGGSCVPPVSVSLTRSAVVNQTILAENGNNSDDSDCAPPPGLDENLGTDDNFTARVSVTAQESEKAQSLGTDECLALFIPCEEYRACELIKIRKYYSSETEIEADFSKYWDFWSTGQSHLGHFTTNSGFYFYFKQSVKSRRNYRAQKLCTQISRRNYYFYDHVIVTKVQWQDGPKSFFVNYNEKIPQASDLSPQEFDFLQELWDKHTKVLCEIDKENVLKEIIHLIEAKKGELRAEILPQLYAVAFPLASPGLILELIKEKQLPINPLLFEHLFPKCVQARDVNAAYDGFCYALQKEPESLDWESNVFYYLSFSPYLEKCARSIFYDYKPGMILPSKLAIQEPVGKIEIRVMTSNGAEKQTHYLNPRQVTKIRDLKQKMLDNNIITEKNWGIDSLLVCYRRTTPQGDFLIPLDCSDITVQFLPFGDSSFGYLLIYVVRPLEIFAHFNQQWSRSIATLAEVTSEGKGSEEKWGKDNKILQNYVRNTFITVKSQNKIHEFCYRSYKNAVFHLGTLTDKDENSLFAVFKTSKPKPKYQFRGDYDLPSEFGQKWEFFFWMNKEELLKRYKIADTPGPPTYYTSLSEITFIQGIDHQINVQHLLKDKQTKERIKKFLPELTEEQLYQEIELALRRADARITNDFTIAIPHYYPAKQIMQLLVPLKLPSAGQGYKLAAVFSPVKSNEGKIISYECPTLLTLGTAYNNARLVKKINHHWLLNEIGEDCVDEEFDNFEYAHVNEDEEKEEEYDQLRKTQKIKKKNQVFYVPKQKNKL